MVKLTGDYGWNILSVKGKAIPLQAWTGPEVSRRLRLPDFQDNRHMKVVRSALRTGRIYLQEIFMILLEAESPGTIMSTKNCSHTIGNRTSDLPARGAGPQPTATGMENSELRTKLSVGNP